MDFLEFKKKFEHKSVEIFDHNVKPDIMVSVCVQTFNQKKYLGQCLESILIQKTNFNFEILLGDDDSSDGTRELCLKYTKKYPDKIRLFLHHRNNNIKIDGKDTGLFNSFYNIYSARGKYIAYCDGDDFWLDENKLQKQVDFLEKNINYVISYHRIITMNESNEKVKRPYDDHFAKDFKSSELQQVLVQPPISTWCFRNKIKEIPIEMTKTINADNFWISLLGSYGAGKFQHNVEPSCYRIHTKGIWSLANRDFQLKSKMNTYSVLMEYYSSKNNLQLSEFFKIRSMGFFKMLYVYHLKRMKLKFVINNFLKFINLKLN